MNRFDFVFSNKTDHTLRFKVYPDKMNNVLVSNDTILVLPPLSASPVISIEGDGTKEIDPVLNAPSSLGMLFGSGAVGKTIIYIDNDQCVEFELLRNTENTMYQYEKLSGSHIKYTYDFTDADLEGAKLCE
jgi:hypothetical protein